MMLWLGTMLLSAVPIPGTVHGQRSGSSCLDSCRADRRPTTEGVGQMRKCTVRTAKSYFVIVNGFASSRAVSMKRPASGLSVRSFKVTMRTGATGLGNSTGKTFRGRRPR
jgi:hypothetical protein